MPHPTKTMICADDCSNETSLFASVIPSYCLAKIRRNKCARNSEQGCYDKSRWLILFSRIKNFAITPATTPIMMVQRICIASSSSWGTDLRPEGVIFND
jgi:hypothetical protein